jgi:hypothetical protein
LEKVANYKLPSGPAGGPPPPAQQLQAPQPRSRSAGITTQSSAGST